MKKLLIYIAIICANALTTSCVVDKENLNAGPIDLKIELVDTGAFSGPGCTKVTVNGNEALRADNAKGFWYWGQITTEGFDQNNNQINASAVNLEKFDGNTGAGAYTTDNKAFILADTTSKTFSVNFSAVNIWALDDCAGCIGLENLSYTSYYFTNVSDNKKHECGRTYKLLLVNKLK